MTCSKWFMKSIGHEGLNNLLAAYTDKSAQAVCTFAYSAGPGHEPILFQGITDGKILPARGPATFGKFMTYLGRESRYRDRY
jgi:inosine triphosphate pyrophosphatase